MNKRQLIIICAICMGFIYISFIYNVCLAQLNLKVSGVLLGKEKTAIINGNIKKVGDFIAEAEIVEINESYVRFKYKGEFYIGRLGKGAEKESGEAEAYGAGAPMHKEDKQIYSVETKIDKEFAKVASKFGVIFIIAMVFLGIFIYALCCFPLQVIANKTGTEKGWLAWIPLANLYLMCKIAGKPGWWIPVLLFIPVVNLVLLAILWMEIAKACNKPAWVGLLIPFVPVVNIVAYLYLAFSKTEAVERLRDEERVEKKEISGQDDNVGIGV